MRQSRVIIFTELRESALEIVKWIDAMGNPTIDLTSLLDEPRERKVSMRPVLSVKTNQKAAQNWINLNGWRKIDCLRSNDNERRRQNDLRGDKGELQVQKRPKLMV